MDDQNLKIGFLSEHSQWYKDTAAYDLYGAWTHLVFSVGFADSINFLNVYMNGN